MDPGGSELDSSLPQPDNPCLIVEDSQPDSVALEDDPESSYRALLARRLSSLQPAARSPVLELISSPLGSRYSQTDSQSESSQSNNQAEPGILMAANPSSAFQEESQVLNISSPPNKKKCAAAEDTDMDAGADSTTHCIQSEEGASQFGFLELSQSQDLRGEAVNSQEEEDDVVPQPDSERRSKLAEQNMSCRTSQSQDNKAVRSEVSSSSSLESSGQTGRQLGIQALLHSEGLQASDEQDCEILSSQEDMFDADKTGAAVDSTVSEPEQQGHPTPTPAQSLRLLHLSGQGTLVQESLSQSSVDYVAPTPDFTHTPLIVPSSPTGPENEHGADEPMDTSLPPEERAGEKEEEPMETEAASKPRPSASTPVSQNSPGFVLERTLSLPSQPEFSHDVFVPTQSQDAPQQSDKKTAVSLPRETPSQRPESAPFTLPLQLSVNTQSCSSAQHVEEDSQATQIEDLEEPTGVDTSDSVVSHQKSESNGVPSESQTASSSKASTSTEPTKHRSECEKKEPSGLSQKSEVHKKTSLNVQHVNVKSGGKEASSADGVSCSQPKFEPSDVTVNSCVQDTPPADTTPCSVPSQSMISQTSAVDVMKKSMDVRKEGGSAKSPSVKSSSQQRGTVGNSQTVRDVTDQRQQGDVEEEEEVMEEEGESTAGGGASGMALVLSQSQLVSPEPMEEEEEDSEDRGDDSVIVVSDSERDSQVPQKDVTPQSKVKSSQPIRGKVSVSTNGHGSQAQAKKVHAAPDRLSQTERAGPEPEGLKDKSLSDSSGEISFHFTLPKEGELIGPVVGATPPLISQLKQTLRHSTPIEITSFSEKSGVAGDVSADGAMAASDIVAGESGDDTTEKGDGKLSLRMKLVTPVEEGSSERFSLQKPALSEEDGSVVKVTTVAKAVTSSPSVFSRVRQVHRQQDSKEDSQTGGNTTPVRAELFASPQRSSPASSLGCNSLPNSQSEPSQQEVLLAAPQETSKDPPGPAGQSEDRRGPPQAPEPPTPNRTDVRQRAPQQTASPSNKLRQRTVSQQTSFDAPGLRSPAGRGEPESPSFRRTTAPAHRRHVRTIQEVRTTVTRIITDVYYEDGKEVERKVTEESEEPVVDCQVLDGDISPCRTGSSSVTSGDLADISSLSSKASSMQHSSGGTSSSGFTRPDFIMPPGRGTVSFSPRRGGGHQQRGHRGHRAGSVVTMNRSYSTLGSRAFVPLTPRGRARRGRPPSRSSMSRGGGPGSLRRLGPHGQPHSSSEEEPYTRMLPPRLPVSPTDAELPSRSDSLRSSPEEANSAGSSFVGLRVVAKWSSNGYFYSGRIIKDAGEGRFRLRFDDGYECEVSGKDILLCDPIPLETEVTALLEDEYFSIGVVRGHKTEGQDLFYSVERDGQMQWYNRNAVILSLEQGNKLREQHSLGPYEPSAPLAKASDISLDNLVEGKRRRRGAPEGQNTPNRSSSSGSPRTPGPSGKRKLMTSEDARSPAKRGRRGSGARAAQRVGLCNTSGSGTDLPGQSGDVMETHGPLPQNTTLFMGFAFMLTASSEIDRLTNKHASDDEDDYVQTGPYNKAYTESQLQAGGGFVLPDFNEEQCKAAYQSLLIADQHCRTRKYLLCLASGVPCVSHLWVRDCCKDNKLLNYRNYLLPAGVGPDEAMVEWHPRCSPFKALRVLLVFEKPVEFWAQLITMGGGSSVRQFQADKDGSDIPAGKYDVVVTDRACPPLVEKNVTSQEVPLVSPEWLIQSVIRGERLGFHSKPQYRHDYSSSS
ncbi:TP53-binding protein 1 isoform X1 [Sebastes umbrosus]|uniref:TP53-binding protein 1 isoform X1 n=2 Tax=Sebastes umbrosus TaxID=72105 RepID=UPI00189E3A61|nr:TP53-binding protein 1 isoform X1 [Sebastes umbrosus]XP_037610837.1 TP53-binding protein 1 isoform X1 [Sebastes umbrosus]XP_037610845.1 TP53-binding protein 1 isoform X1 [Sebastes umbrosus]XP_037610854.1 TP53-binding protein 1 isoform X1 [Sebastes umbrosus]XP_037610864.1 TP53-binding protein 1 isoform X1 [Sebastes umbrosus]